MLWEPSTCLALVEALDKELQCERAEITQFLEQRHTLLLSRISTRFEAVSPGNGSSAHSESVPAGLVSAGFANQTPVKSTYVNVVAQRVIQPILVEEEETRDSAELDDVAEKPETLRTCSPSDANNSQTTPSRRSIRSPIPPAADESSQAKTRWFQILATSLVFEGVFASLIVASAIVMAVEVQYEGLMVGAQIGYEQDFEAWPSIRVILDVLEYLFGCVFAFEVFVKLVAMKCDFVKSGWNWLDTIVVISWLIDRIADGVIPNPLIFRLARLLRLLRLVRLVKTAQVFDTLHLLVGALKASGSALLWSMVLLFFAMLGGSVLLSYGLRDFMLDRENLTTGTSVQAFEYFGTFARGMVSMFELTLGNWVPITRFLQDNVNEWFGPVILLYQSFISFAVVTVIRGIFLHETLSVAAQDDELMIMRKLRAMKHHAEKMTRLFEDADESGDGALDYEEFKECVNDPRVKAWLSAMDLEVRDIGLLFELVGGGTGRLYAEDLVMGFARLKGPARSFDMVASLQEHHRTQALIKSLHEECSYEEGKRQRARPQSEEVTI